MLEDLKEKYKDNKTIIGNKQNSGILDDLRAKYINTNAEKLDKQNLQPKQDNSVDIKINTLTDDALNKEIRNLQEKLFTTNSPTERQAISKAISNLKNNQAQRVQKDKEEQEQKDAIKQTVNGAVSNIVKPGAFEDGYQFGDVTKTAVSTVGDVATQSAKAVAGIGEGIIDLGMYGTGLISKAVGNEQFGNSMIEKANINAVDNVFKDFEKNIDKNSIIGNTGDDVVQAVTHALTLALPGVGAMKIAQAAGKTGKIASTIGTSATTFASSMGRGMSTAYNSGATDEEALAYGMIKGTSDTVTEWTFGGMGKLLPILGYNKGAIPLDDVLAQKLSSKVQSVLTKNLIEAGVKMTGEGLEEVLAGTLDAVGQKLTYMSEEDLSKLIQDQNLLEQFLMGAVVSGVIQAPGVVSNVRSNQAPYNNDNNVAINNVLSDNVEQINANNAVNTVEKQMKQDNGNNVQNIVADIENFANQIENINNIKENNNLVVLNNTPQVYKDLGINDLPMTITKNHTLWAMTPKDNKNTHYHGISKETLKQIPEALTKPLNIVLSGSRNDSVVAITELADEEGNLIIVPIKVRNGKANVNEIEIDSNVLTSIYGKDKDYDTWMKKNIENDRVLYDIDDGIIKKYRDNPPRLQLPNDIISSSVSSTSNTSINNILPQNKNYVNTQQENITNHFGLMENASRTYIQKQNEAIANDSLVKFEESRRKKDSLIDMTRLNPQELEVMTQFTKTNQEKGRVADILIDSEASKSTFKEKVSDIWSALKRELVDSGDEIQQLGKRTDDPLLYQLYNNAKQSWATTNYNLGEAQVDILGNKVGESLKDIFEPIRQKGDTYYKDFSTYIYEYHNIDRLNEAIKRGKPDALKVTGHSIFESKKMIKGFEKQYPEFKKLANKVWKYNANSLKYKVDAGLISMEQAVNFLKMYPHYVPTYRDVNGVSGSFVGGKKISIANGKRATGSTAPLLPLHEQMARQTAQSIQAGRRNLLGIALYKSYLQNPEAFQDDILKLSVGKNDTMEVQALNQAYNEEQNGFAEELEDNTSDKTSLIDNEFSFYVNGEKVTLKINDKLFSAIKDISAQKDDGFVLQAINTVNNLFKKTVTTWNPLFLITNHIKDMQDAGLYTEQIGTLAKKYPEAIAQMAKNSDAWQKYQALGGFGSSLFDMQKGYVQEPKTTTGKIASAPAKWIEQANYVVEQLPRFTEFLRTMEGKDFNSYTDLQAAMLNSADITVNFGRSGRIGKVINKIVPFFNAAIQGSSKAVREFSKKRDLKGAVLFASKAALLGIPASIVSEMLFGDDDDYKKLREEDKDLYYLIKTEDGNFIKIPKGRILSVLGAISRSLYKTAQGDDTAQDIGKLVKFGMQQAGPVNPFENYIGAAIGQAINNKTWYGTPIVDKSLEDFKPSMQYDETTSEIAKSLGKTLNISPKKIHYVIDQMTGVIGDIILPMTTKQAETGIVKKKFVLDSVTSNRLSGDFYDTIEKLTQDKKDTESKTSEESGYALNYLNDVKKEISIYSDFIKKVQNSNISDKEKLTKVREYRKEMNEKYEMALSLYEDFAKEYSKNANKIGDEELNEVYTKYKLYEQEDDVTILQRSAPNYITYNKEKLTLTPEQKTKWQKDSGSYIKNNINKLINSSNYKNAKEEAKAKMLEELVNRAYDIAKLKFLNER